jgi:hypothetical protein
LQAEGIRDALHCLRKYSILLLGGAPLQRRDNSFALIAALAVEGIFKLSPRRSPHSEKFSTRLRKSLWKSGKLLL